MDLPVSSALPGTQEPLVIPVLLDITQVLPIPSPVPVAHWLLTIASCVNWPPLVLSAPLDTQELNAPLVQLDITIAAVEV